MSDDRIQEIFTRAVAGRAKRRLTWVHTFAAENVKHVLGVHLGSTAVSVKEENGQPTVEVSVHCDLWCRDDKDTTVLQTTAQSAFEVDVPTSGQVVGEREVRVALVDSPRSTGVKVADGQIHLSLEVDISVEITASVRIWVRTVDLGGAVQTSSAESDEEPTQAVQEQPREKGKQKGK